MKGTLDTVRMLVSAQTLVTAFLAVLLWSLYTRLHRQEFNRWWASAWTLSALHLGAFGLVLRLPAGWSLAKGAALLLTNSVGFLVAPALVFGAMSLRSPGTITRRVALSGAAAAVLLAVISFAISFHWAAGPLNRFAVRNGARMLTLGVALFYCAWVFIGQARETRSWAALVTALSCLIYGIDQAVYTAATTLHLLSAVPRGTDVSRGVLLTSASLMYLDIGLTCGICLGMVLLLLEEYQRSERALAESVNRRRDVTEQNSALQQEIRRRQEVELRLVASEDRYRDLVEHSEDLVCTHDLDGRLLSCNPAPARILGYDVQEILTMSLRDFLPAGVPQGLFDEYVRTLQREGVASGLVKVVTRQGERRLWEFRNTLRTGGVATPIVRGMARDVTDQKRADQRALDLQAELAHAGRVMALGTLTGSLAHEINQPLAATRANAYAALRLLEANPPDLGEVRDALRDIMSDNKRIDEVLLRMRGLLRKERRNYAPIDVNAIVEDVLKLVHSNLIERRISIGVELGSDIPAVLGDRVQLQQVVLNILMNAADAVGAAEHPDDRRVTVTTAASGARVSVAVADRGGAVADAEFDRMFDPFFTTKADGMGLGLSISRTIMDAHGGQISARRNPDRGLTCSFVLDAAAVSANPAVMPVGRPATAARMDA